MTNSTIRNTGSHGIIASADSGNLDWAVTGSTFANVTEQDVFSNTTTAASQNVTVANCNSTGGLLQFVFVDANTSGSVGLNMTNNTVQGNGVKGRGLSIATASSCSFVGLVSANNITGCTDIGIRFVANGTSNARARFVGNRTVGNLLNSGVVVVSQAAGSFVGCIFQNNVSDRFSLNGGIGTLQVEQLAQFNLASNNVGTLSTTSVTDVPAGTLGLP